MAKHHRPLAAILAALIALPALAAPGIPNPIGSNSAIANAGTTVVVTTTADSPPGTLIVVAVDYRAITSITGCTDNASTPNTYTSGGGTTTGTTSQEAILYSVATTDLPAGGTITCTFAATAGAKMVASFGVTGISTTPYDAPAASSAFATSTTPSTTTGTFAVSSELAFAALGITNSQTVTEDANWTTLTEVVSSGKLHVAYRLITSTAPVTYAPTLGALSAWTVQAQGFMAAGSIAATLCTMTILNVGAC